MTSSFPTVVLEQLTQVFNQIPFNRMLGLRLDAIEKDHIVSSFDMKKELVGNFLYGILHGGVISSVLDMAGGIASMFAAVQKNPEKKISELETLLGKASTINLNINFLKPGKGEHFIAKAWVQHAGAKVTFTRMELFNPDSLIASATGTYRIG